MRFSSGLLAQLEPSTNSVLMKWSSSRDGVWFDMRLGDVDVKLSQFETV